MLKGLNGSHAQTGLHKSQRLHQNIIATDQRRTPGKKLFPNTFGCLMIAIIGIKNREKSRCINKDLHSS